jgi:hypothetical protein
MADPASILGLISASLTITIRAATIGKDLHSLIAKYKTTNSKVRQLSVHVAAVRVAARSLSSWLEEDAIGSEEVEDVKSELLEVLSACCGLLSDLQDHVTKALAGVENVGFKGAVTYMWDEDIVKETMEMLHHQETAILLILQTLGQLTRKEQRVKMQEQEVVRTLTRAKRPSSSIFGICGDDRSSTRFSYVSENSERMSAIFTFDMEVMSSSAYRNAFTSLLRRNVTRQPIDRNSVVTITPTDVTVGVQDTIDNIVGEAISSEHKIEQTNISRPLPKLLLPVISIIPGEDPNTTSDGVNFAMALGETKSHVGDGFSGAPQKPVISRESTRSPAKSRLASKETGWWRAMYDYDADDNTSLSFQKGDIIQVITLLESGWHDGVIHGIRGWFPSNYGEFIDLEKLNEGFVGQEAYTSSESDDSDIEESLQLELRSKIKNEDEFWIPQATPDGRLFYYNTLTGVSRMELPIIGGDISEPPQSELKGKVKDEDEFWIPQATPDGRLFYFNTLTGASSKELLLT